MIMKKYAINKLTALLAATTLSAVTFAGMSVTSANAAEKTIAYTQSEGSLSTDNDGVSLRRNIYNVWTSPQIEDINGSTTVEEYIAVDFTVSGIGDASALDDGSQFYAWIAGSVGTNSQWTLADAGDNITAINGDGDYTVTMPLADPSASIECLILQTNINIYAFGGDVSATTANLTINSIKTVQNAILGDVNSDGSVDSSDAALILKDYATVQANGSSTLDKSIADFNGDDAVDSSDAALILKAYADAQAQK